MDTRFTQNLANAYPTWLTAMKKTGAELPRKVLGPDRKLRYLDCAVINWYLDALERVTGTEYDTVRCGFTEGGEAFPGSGIHRKTHVQIAVRNPACIVGVFQAHDAGVMSEPSAPSPSVLPPHENAEPHRRLMEKLSKMTPAEVLETSVQAGIHTPQGKLTRHYRDEPTTAQKKAR